MAKKYHVYILFVATLFIAIFTAVLFARLRTPLDVAPVSDKIVLSYWGMFYPSEVMQPLIDKYQEQNSNVEIMYTERKYENLAEYKDLLKTRLKEANGPLIFRIHSTWVPEYMPEINFTNSVITADEFTEMFYPIARTQCVTQGGAILCIPLMYDGIVLLYNRPMFQVATASLPRTWEDLSVTAQRLTIRSEDSIRRGGVALGTASNVANSSDLLALMMLQSKVRIPNSLNSESAVAALNFYTDFARVHQVWNSNMPYSTIAFATERVAMIFARNSDIQEVLDLNPTLEFGVTDVPQLPTIEGGLTNNNWASFWVESVSADATDKEQIAAWEFLKWMAQTEQQMDLNRELSKYSKVTEVSGNKALAGIFSDDPYLSMIAKGAPTASTNLVTDNAGNNAYANTLKNAINDMGKSRMTVHELLNTAKAQYQALLDARFKSYPANN